MKKSLPLLLALVTGCGAVSVPQTQTLQQISKEFDDGVKVTLEGREETAKETIEGYKEGMKPYEQETKNIYKRAKEFGIKKDKILEKYETKSKEIRQRIRGSKKWWDNIKKWDLQRNYCLEE